jgi:hypothetical protein
MQSATQISFRMGYSLKTWQIGFWWGETERGVNTLPGKQLTLSFLCFVFRVDVQEVFL